MNTLQLKFRKLIRETKIDFLRYMHTRINWQARLVGLTGPRGVGKTTMILQHIKSELNLDEALYVTAEDFYFAENRLLDLADQFTKMGGKYLFIDEVHKYKDWSKELKLIYDYHPDLQVVFTGSSVLDINKGVADLSRRAVMYNMQGLSFREYLILFHNIELEAVTLDDVLNHRVETPENFRPFVYFSDYLKRGYYPFAIDCDFSQRLMQVINQTLEVDIPMYAEMNVSTGRKLKQLLSIISRSVPFKLNTSSIANAIGSNRSSIADYLLYIEEAGLISQLRTSAGGIRALGKVDKIYLDNTNLIDTLAAKTSEIGNIRETFFMNQVRLSHSVISSQQSDFEVDGYTFEVGGKSKKQRQIEGVEDGYIVKDDIEFGYRNIIPLWMFGLLY